MPLLVLLLGWTAWCTACVVDAYHGMSCGGERCVVPRDVWVGSLCERNVTASAALLVRWAPTLVTFTVGDARLAVSNASDGAPLLELQLEGAGDGIRIVTGDNDVGLNTTLTLGDPSVVARHVDALLSPAGGALTLHASASVRSASFTGGIPVWLPRVSFSSTLVCKNQSCALDGAPPPPPAPPPSPPPAPRQWSVGALSIERAAAATLRLSASLGAAAALPLTLAPLPPIGASLEWGGGGGGGAAEFSIAGGAAVRRGAASVEASAELRADSAARGRTWQRLLRTALGGEGGAAARRLSLRFDGGAAPTPRATCRRSSARCRQSRSPSRCPTSSLPPRRAAAAAAAVDGLPSTNRASCLATRRSPSRE